MKKCTIIGIADNRQQWFPPAVEAEIAQGKVFSGGKRHREIMSHCLPHDAEWIDITVPLADVFRRYELCDEVVVFASGDPLFYGFAATVQRECPQCQIKVYPSFHSLQMLAHRMVLPYQDMRMVSQTGRPWQPLDEALIRGEQLVGVLTDRHKTPQAIAQRMLDYGYANYRITVGECLGNETDECVSAYESVAALATEPRTFTVPNCMVMQQLSPRPHPFGIPESQFHLLNGRAKMITKMPVRLLSLSMLALSERSSLWDVGFCTGSVSIEAKLQFPHLAVTSFEVREEGRELMEVNSRRFGAPGIEAVIGDFLTLPLDGYPRPDAVFIGGHGGKLIPMLHRLRQHMLPHACIVFNSVSEESKQLFEQGVAEIGMTITQSTHLQVDSHNPIWIMKAEA